MQLCTLLNICAQYQEESCQAKLAQEYSVFKRLLKFTIGLCVSYWCRYANTFIFKCILLACLFIAHYNMDRIRFVWLRIWKILAEHFCFAGTHSNLRISLSAIDSLRQLADKFLEKDELSNFNVIFLSLLCVYVILIEVIFFKKNKTKKKRCLKYKMDHSSKKIF
ncbi:SEC7/BIG-like ARF-guanine nucleotide exchange factor [Reticulomyxa filosa]|uniref:SEC7/BIG-like ARF-guanine nucleotide exchange factor n=1 Tax=Reticulomyxa filosa TaxID=46433 RepID=X6MCZ8_RETFI|nr:SEC7/BIG-like ARF-guanine nucleotide exchange factor [Reticulomyxa filosa]|eukprot:ETO11322.1 SEC7/BIG-like ARF-guanine nucleotide exchange factor [Reticulomyxa filosa]